MSALFLLLFISIAVAVVFLIAFLWSVKRGQYDDDYTPAVRMLFEDSPEVTNKETKSNQPK
ncbi:MAG: cbb3-type cytochrome oxidase assembly protein CcoS [Bacteroidia bacterium]